MAIKLTQEYNIRRVYAGSNATALLTTSGKVLICGNNSYSKLGFENIAYIKTFLIMSAINERMREIALGQTHSVFLSENGEVFCMGNGEDGQCGSGMSIYKMFNKIDGITKTTKISTGPCYTLAATEDNAIYFWGTHYASIRSENGEGSRPEHMFQSDHVIQIESRYTEMKYMVSARDRAYTPVLELTPKPILASKNNLKAGNSVWLAGLTANDNSVSILVHTTSPPPIKKISEDEQDPRSETLGPQYTSFQQISNSGISLPNTPQP